tara:strand:+ start:664 stop:1275 length:612 start_codon:yes stop_codon:yes gene_type:complete
MHQELKKHFQVFKNFDCYFWIGGMCIYDLLNDITPNDIDVFFRREKDANKIVEFLTKKKRFSIEIKRSAGALLKAPDGTLYDILCVARSPEHLFHNFFDYSVACAAVDTNNFFWHHEDYFAHCEEKKLYYIENGPRNEGGKFKRLSKMLSKGFSIDSENLQKWLKKVQEDKKSLKINKFNLKSIYFQKLENLEFDIKKIKLKD